MKKLFILLSVIFVSTTCFNACCDDDNCDPVPCYCSEEGVIIGIDYRECACCGGWFIEVGEDTLRAWTLPTEFQESLINEEFPLNVYLEWSPMENPCLGDEIEVECIRRQE